MNSIMDQWKLMIFGDLIDVLAANSHIATGCWIFLKKKKNCVSYCQILTRPQFSRRSSLSVNSLSLSDKNKKKLLRPRFIHFQLTWFILISFLFASIDFDSLLCCSLLSFSERSTLFNVCICSHRSHFLNNYSSSVKCWFNRSEFRSRFFSPLIFHVGI